MRKIAFAFLFMSLRAPAAEPPRMLVEIYHIAPGEHTAFLEAIANAAPALHPR
ncbi:MAG TPA: hypothetical protein VER58_19485 [Thermoanaerobaculia bacterium]|nr:hypothetical protein [Thermoanaerobaculia bacterium]